MDLDACMYVYAFFWLSQLKEPKVKARSINEHT